jgi:hypothetical protein
LLEGVFERLIYKSDLLESGVGVYPVPLLLFLISAFLEIPSWALLILQWTHILVMDFLR